MSLLPYEKLVPLIVQKTSKERSEIETLIEQKVKEFSGLISKEGAAHVIANELGVDVMTVMRQPLEIADIPAGNKDISLHAKVIKIYPIREFSKNGNSGKVGSTLLGDDTGLIRLTFWHEQTDLLSQFSEGDIVTFSHVQSKMNQDRIELTYTNSSTFEKNPKGITFSQVKMQQSTPLEPQAVAKIESVSQGYHTVLGNLVQLYPPSFYKVDAQTGKKALNDSQQTVDAYVMNGVLDDGTDTIRIVCFREQALELLGNILHKNMLELKDNPIIFEELRKQLLGMFVQVSGKVTYNEQYDRKELLVNSISTDPNPQDI